VTTIHDRGNLNSARMQISFWEGQRYAAISHINKGLGKMSEDLAL
jgi:hypothetical protein